MNMTHRDITGFFMACPRVYFFVNASLFSVRWLNNYDCKQLGSSN